MTSRFAGRRAVVTGGALGMGRATVETLLAEGARVAVVDQNADALAALGNEVANEHLNTQVADVRDEAAYEAALQDAWIALGEGAGHHGAHCGGQSRWAGRKTKQRRLGLALRHQPAQSRDQPSICGTGNDERRRRRQYVLHFGPPGRSGLGGVQRHQGRDQEPDGIVCA